MFEGLRSYLGVPEMKLSNKTFFVLMIIAYLFSLGVRFYYYHWASQIPEFVWHHVLMINNPDGYYYAAGAKEILTHSHILGDNNPYHSFPSMLTAWIVKFTPWNLDEVILWMPAVFSSLIVVPLMLMGRTLKNDFVGFGAALIGSIAWSYYNRTLIGYYDTDMLVIVFLAFVFWEIMEFFINENEAVFYLLPFTVALYEWWYPQCRTVLLALGIFGLIYLSLFDKKKEKFVFLALYFLLLSKFPFYANLVLGYLFFFLFKKKREFLNDNKYIWGIYLIIFAILYFSGSFDLLILKFMSYLHRGVVDIDRLHYYSVMKTIMEASPIPYTVVMDRISGGVFLFAFAAVGYLLLMFRYPVFIISVPSVVLGLLAHKIGLRFTIYALPFFAVSFSYFALLLSLYVSRLFKQSVSKITFFILFSLLIAVSLYANIKHVVYYKVPTVFLRQEVASLNRLSKMASGEDYVYTWWDYGYPIRYYAGVKTVIDGGIHSGADNYPVSFSLTRNQLAAVNMAKLYVPFVDKKMVDKELNKTFTKKDFISYEMDKYHIKNVNEFLAMLNSPNFNAPKFKHRIYFYLPFRMFDIFPTITIFSSIDLSNGKLHMPFVFSARVLKASPKGIVFTRGAYLDSRGILHIGKDGVPINTFFIGYYEKGKYRVVGDRFYPQSNVFVLWYKPLDRVLIIDKRLLNSTFVQLFFFENYDKKLFKPVILNPYVKIYEVKG
jgi:dolichyl-diphosphooligosaccharide--protein glycosyltransferase/undecaprenyl-diphosphooligosaccharide--protein glycosyltransferase